MPLQVFAVYRTCVFQPVLHQRAVHVVVVDPALVAGVVGRVDVDAIHAPGVAREQRLQRVQVVAVDNQIVVK